jgi:hypothetical protein
MCAKNSKTRAPTYHNSIFNIQVHKKIQQFFYLHHTQSFYYECAKLKISKKNNNNTALAIAAAVKKWAEIKHNDNVRKKERVQQHL